MFSQTLLNILNKEIGIYALLNRLKDEQFSLTDLTEDGDTILHVLAKSNLVKNYNFNTYVSTFCEAGVDFNRLDKDGKDWVYYCLRTEPYDAGKLILSLLHYDYDISRVTPSGKTVFEMIYEYKNSIRSFDRRSIFEHPKFNPNQKTSQHESVVFFLLMNLSVNKELLEILLTRKDTNPNIKNWQGQTPLAFLLASTAYIDIGLFKLILNHPQLDINAVDEEGNSYFHLVMKREQIQKKVLIDLILAKGVDTNLKNKAGQRAIEIIPPVTGNEEDLLAHVYTERPEMVLENDEQGNPRLCALLKSANFTTQKKLPMLLSACKGLASAEEKLREALHACFVAYRNKQLSEETMSSLVEAIVKDPISIDVEYCLALLALYPAKSTYQLKIMCNQLTTLQPQLDIGKVIELIKQQSTPGSEEQSKAIATICRYAIPSTAFDQASIDLEINELRKEQTERVDAKLFAHLFSLKGDVPLGKGAATLEGNNSKESLVFMGYLMNAYYLDCKSKNKYPEHIDAIRKVRDHSIKARRYHELSMSWHDDKAFDAIVVESKNQGIEIATGWEGHAVNIVFQGTDMYRNNGGGCSFDTTSEHYHVTKPENLTGAVFSKLYKQSSSESNKTYIQQDLHSLLGLEYKGAIDGTFQTVGNCSFESLRIALKVKFRLFLPQAIADEIYQDCVQFFEEFFLEQFIKQYANTPQLPQILLRLITQKLLPEKNFELAKRLLKEHFTSETNQEVLQMELMLHQWKRKVAGLPADEFNEQLNELGINLNPALNSRTEVLDRFLNNKSTPADLAEFKSWPADKQQFQGYHPLFFAVMNDDIDLATSIIGMFPTAVNKTNWYEQNPLFVVRSVAMIDLLVKAGAKTDQVKDDNALDYAIKADRADLVKALLKHGVKPSDYSAYYAATKDPKILILLHQHHPKSLTVRTHSYMTAAHAAAAGGHVENLRTTIYYGGADVNATDVNGVTPLQLALKKKKTTTATVLANHPNSFFAGPHRGDKVIDMTEDDELKKVVASKEQEKNDDKAYYQTFKNSDPGRAYQEIDYLIIALRNNDIRAIRGCLQENPALKVYDNSNHYCTSPLANAILNLGGAKGQQYQDRLAIVELLLQTPSIDLNAYTMTGEPLIFMATSIDNVDVLELFLKDYRLAPNKQDPMGYTALHDAAERGHLKCVRRLLQDERIDCNMVNKHNKTAAELDCIRENGDECKEEILAHQRRNQLKA